MQIGIEMIKISPFYIKYSNTMTDITIVSIAAFKIPLVSKSALKDFLVSMDEINKIT
jgi:hypothetical protein